MKKRLNLLALIASTVLALAGCEPVPTPTPTPTPPADQFSLTLTSSKITTTTAQVTATASNDDQSYFLGHLTKAEFQELSGNIQIHDYINSYVQRMAEAQGISTSEYLVSSLHKGSATMALENLEPNSSYIALAIGMDSSGEFFDAPKSLEFKTLEAPATQSITINIESVEETLVKVTATPTLQDRDYYIAAIKSSLVASLGSPEAINNHLQEELYNFYSELPADRQGDAYGANTQQGTVSEEFNLEANTEYVIAAVNVEFSKVIESEVFYSANFSTPDIQLGTIEIKIKEYNSYAATFESTPSFSDSRYFTVLLSEEELTPLASVEDIKEYMAGTLIAKCNGSEQIYNEITDMGTAMRTFENLQPASKYTAYSLGLTLNGGVTSNLSPGVEVTTLGGLSFTTTLEEATSSSIDIEITPSNDSDRYYSDIISEKAYNYYNQNKETIKNLLLQEHIAATASMTTEQKADYYKSITSDGQSDLSAEDLLSGTNFRAVIFGLNTSGVVTTEVHISEPYTTTGVGQLDFEFSSSAEPLATEVTLHVTPIGHNQRYYTSVIAEDVITSIGGDNKVADYVLGELEKQREAAAESKIAFYSSVTNIGEIDKVIKNLEFNTRYAVYAFGLSDEGEITSAINIAPDGIILTGNSRGMIAKSPYFFEQSIGKKTK